MFSTAQFLCILSPLKHVEGDRYIETHQYLDWHQQSLVYSRAVATEQLWTLQGQKTMHVGGKETAGKVTTAAALVVNGTTLQQLCFLRQKDCSASTKMELHAAAIKAAVGLRCIKLFTCSSGWILSPRTFFAAKISVTADPHLLTAT